jgi:hypothetical protein
VELELKARDRGAISGFIKRFDKMLILAHQQSTICFFTYTIGSYAADRSSYYFNVSAKTAIRDGS